MPNVTAAPFFVQKPLIRLGPTGSFIEIQCAVTHVDFTPDQDEKTAETFCGTYTSYGSPKWIGTVTLAQSYGTNGSWTLLDPLTNTIVPFAVSPDIGVPSVSNPVISGTCYVKSFAFIDAAPGEASEVDLVLAVQGALTRGIVLPTALEGEPAGVIA